MSAKAFTITIQKDVLDDFKIYCEEKSLKMSTRIQSMIKEELKTWKKTPLS